MDNKKIILYHGSTVEVEHPKVLTNGFYKDFGYGFYCTNIKAQAEKWARTKRGKSVVNVYEYNAQHDLNVLFFPSMTEEWLDFVVACRRGIESDYDIVEAPMADDTIWDYVEEFVAGGISREAFWALA